MMTTTKQAGCKKNRTISKLFDGILVSHQWFLAFRHSWTLDELAICVFFMYNSRVNEQKEAEMMGRLGLMFAILNMLWDEFSK